MSIYRRAVTMKNVNMIRTTTIFNNVQYSINDHLIDDKPYSYNSELQSKLDDIRIRIVHGLLKIKGFLFEKIKNDNFDQEQLSKLIKESVLVQNWFEDKGYSKLKALETTIDKKDINADDFDELSHVFDDQKALYQNLFDRELTFEQVEIMLRYLQELPFYLEFDLNLDKLSNKRKIKRTIKINVKQEITDINYYKHAV